MTPRPADGSAHGGTPTLAASTARIFDLSLGQMLWSRRSIFLALLAGGPVLVAAVIHAASSSALGTFQVNGSRVPGSSLFGVMVWLLYVRFIVPVLGIFYGTSLIADEVEDKTITYLFTRPIPRSAVILGKYLAYAVCTILLVLPSVMLVYFLVATTGGSTLAESFIPLLEDFAMLAIGLAAYGAVFAFVGARLKRPLVAGLVFAFGWEPTVLLFPGYLKRLTVAYYLQGLVAHEMPQDSVTSLLTQAFREVPSATTSVAALAAIAALALWQACRAVESREYVLDQ